MANNYLGGITLRKYLIVFILFFLIVVLVLYQESHRLEHITRNSGFEYDKAGNYSEYVGYKYEFETDDSEYCSQMKSANFYTRVKPYVGNKIYYYCDNGNNEIYEFEYDFDEKKLNPVSDSSVFSSDLTLDEKEQKKYNDIFKLEFSQFNSDLIRQWND